MLTARFGEDFVGRLAGNLDVKAVESHKKEQRGQGKRKTDKKDRPPR